MMKKLLCDRKGETLVEVLAAILIFTLSSIILYSMVTSASKVNLKTRETFDAIGEQMAVVEHAETKVGTEKIKMTLEDGTVICDTDVDVYQSEGEDTLYSYYKAIP